MKRLTVLFVLLLAPSAHAVDTGCAGLQATLDAAPAGSTVRLTETCSGENYTLPPRSIIFEGATGAGFVQDAAVSARALTGSNVGTTTIRGLRFHGYTVTANAGGALRLSGDSAPIIENNVFTANAAASGGAMQILSTSAGPDPVVLRNNRFGGASVPEGNAAQGGGAVSLDSTAPVVVEDNRFESNRSTGGGGGLFLTSVNTSVAVRRNVFRANEATNSGGALYMGVALPELSSNVFTDNLAGQAGGGVYLSESVAAGTGTSVLNRFEGNRAGTGGGGLRAEMSLRSTRDFFRGNRVVTGARGGAILAGSTGTSQRVFEGFGIVVYGNFSDNSAATHPGIAVTSSSQVSDPRTMLRLRNATVSANVDEGSGASVQVGLDARSELDAHNSIVHPGPATGTSVEGGASIAMQHSDACVSSSADPFSGAGNICAKPLFTLTAGGQLFQVSGSPTIDAGSNALIPPGTTVDSDGGARITDGNGDGTATVDMGAEETLGTVDLAPSLSASPASVTAPGTVTVTASIVNNGADVAPAVFLVVEGAGGGTADGCVAVEVGLRCAAGDLAAGAVKTFTITLPLGAPQTRDLKAYGQTALVDRVPGNDQATLTVSATAPPASTPTPTPSPTATPTPTPVAVNLARVLGAPSARACRRSRRLSLRLRPPAGVRFTSVRITLNGRRVRLRGIPARVTLTLPRRGRARIVVTVRTADGRTFTFRRTYRRC